MLAVARETSYPSSMEQQVGLHVIETLRHPRTIGVLTTVASGEDGSQQIVSFGSIQIA